MLLTPDLKKLLTCTKIFRVKNQCSSFNALGNDLLY